jgi:hypothetical protein
MASPRAIIVETRGHVMLQDVSLPEVPVDYILVKTKAGKLR